MVKFPPKMGPLSVGQVRREELDHLCTVLHRPKPPKGDQLGSITIALNAARNVRDRRCDPDRWWAGTGIAEPTDWRSQENGSILTLS